MKSSVNLTNYNEKCNRKGQDGQKNGGGIMKIHFDRTSAGFTAEKSEKTGKIAQAAKSDVLVSTSAAMPDTQDAVELSNRKIAVLNSVRESNVDALSAETGPEQFKAMRSRLASITGYMQDNPQEALAAHANLDPETVTRLIS